MKESCDEKYEPSKYGKLLPYVALVVMLSCTVYVWRLWSNTDAEKEQHRYGGYTDQTVSAITNRLQTYVMILNGFAGLIAASEELTRHEWRAYSEYRQVPMHFPGVQGIGFSRVIKPSELARHIQGIRAEGFPEALVGRHSCHCIVY